MNNKSEQSHLRDMRANEMVALWNTQSIDFAIVFMELDATVVSVNAAVERVLGYAPEELIGSSLRKIFTPEDLALGLDQHELEVARSLGRAEDDRWHVGKGGRRVWISGVLVALKDDAGQTIGFAKLLRDRTDLRGQIAAMENRLAVANAEAARRDAFFATFGHELRNPLHSLGNAYELLKGVCPGPRGEKVLEVVARQLAALTRMANDLRDARDFGRRPAGLQFQALELNAAVRSAVELHKAAAKERSQDLRCIVPRAKITLEADPVRLEQVLRNLIDNAIKYTPPHGHVFVTATVEASTAVIRVEDDGFGMAADVLPRVFDLFTREPRAAASETSGSGIGLAVVKDLVSLHSGTVEVQSAGPGKGSEFTVRLPLQQPRPEAG